MIKNLWLLCSGKLKQHFTRDLTMNVQDVQEVVQHQVSVRI